MLGRCIESKRFSTGRDVCEAACIAGRFTIWEYRAPEVLLVGAGVDLARGGIGSGVGCMRQFGGGAPVALSLQPVCGFFAVPFWEGTHPAMWFWKSIARCLCVASFTFLWPGSSTVRFFSCHISAQCFVIIYWVFSIAAREHSPLAISAVFKTRCMLDCSSCTWSPCLAIVADMFNTYKKLVGASNKTIGLLPWPYTLP
jgi:hypothetical protein